MSITEPWLSWAIELQTLSQNGLTYTENIYERERYERIREISAEMLSYQTEMPVEKVKELFCNETGYQTPKVSTRGVVFKGDAVLLVRENNGLWTLPGGWCDVDQTIGSNTVKEVYEEAGMVVKAERILMIQDRNKHNRPITPYGHIKFFVECKYISGEFKPNSETTEAGFFPISALPPLEELKTTAEQLKTCFELFKDPYHKTIFD